MKVLIVEDDLNKQRQLRQAVEGIDPGVQIREAMSYRSGVQTIIDWQPDVVLLDMTLPTYDVTSNDSGGRTRIFGGRDILTEMKRRSLSSKVVLVTQFESFGEGPKRKTLTEMTGELVATFPHLFSGAVYYHPARSDWRSDIERLLSEVAR